MVKCVVPRVVGLKLKKAKARVGSRHCRVGRLTAKVSALKMKGKVLAQKPKPGKVLRERGRVDLVVGKGPRRR